MKLLTQNAKIKKSGNENESIYNFGIIAYKSLDGSLTCPMAGSCGKEAGCYAQQGAYVWGNVEAAFEARYQLTKDTSKFYAAMTKEIATKQKTAIRQGKQVVIRIHDSGDFYSQQYLDNWLKIINNFPDVKFYAYTKMVPMFNKLARFPSNFTVIYSFGGKADHLIKDNDRHSQVFPDLASLLQAGYDDVTKDDTIAYKSVSGKVGLVYHGAKSKTWTTA